MVVVLDTSAAIEIILGRKHAKKLGEQVAGADWVIAPGLFISEVANVIWKYHQFGDIPIAQCEAVIEETVNLVDEYVDDVMLYKEAFALACQTQTPVYDMFFLALARRNNGYLMTLDKALARTAKKNAIRFIHPEL